MNGGISMAFDKIKEKEGVDTTAPLSGVLGTGTHRVRIWEVLPFGQDRIEITYRNTFTERFVERVFLENDKQEISPRLRDLLGVLDLDVVKQYTETRDYNILKGQKLRINIARSFGDVVIKRGGEYILKKADGTQETYKDYESANKNVTTKSYWKVSKYLPYEKPESDRVW